MKKYQLEIDLLMDEPRYRITKGGGIPQQLDLSLDEFKKKDQSQMIVRILVDSSRDVFQSLEGFESIEELEIVACQNCDSLNLEGIERMERLEKL